MPVNIIVRSLVLGISDWWHLICWCEQNTTSPKWLLERFSSHIVRPAGKPLNSRNGTWVEDMTQLWPTCPWAFHLHGRLSILMNDNLGIVLNIILYFLQHRLLYNLAVLLRTILKQLFGWWCQHSFHGCFQSALDNVYLNNFTVSETVRCYCSESM